MVSDVRVKIRTMSEGEVVSLLGPSEAIEDDLHLFEGCEHCLVYELGLEPGLIRVDPDHLVIRIEDGRVGSSIIQ
jgi:hypothetical protein